MHRCSCTLAASAGSTAGSTTHSLCASAASACAHAKRARAQDTRQRGRALRALRCAHSRLAFSSATTASRSACAAAASSLAGKRVPCCAWWCPCTTARNMQLPSPAAAAAHAAERVRRTCSDAVSQPFACVHVHACMCIRACMCSCQLHARPAPAPPTCVLTAPVMPCRRKPPGLLAATAAAVLSA